MELYAEKQPTGRFQKDNSASSVVKRLYSMTTDR